MRTLSIILAAMLTVSVAHADIVATSPNDAGGEIRLTDEQSNCLEGMRYFYVTSRTGNILVGCWKMLDGDVFARFRDGTLRLYNSSGFTLKGERATARKQGGTL